MAGEISNDARRNERAAAHANVTRRNARKREKKLALNYITSDRLTTSCLSVEKRREENGRFFDATRSRGRRKRDGGASSCDAILTLERGEKSADIIGRKNRLEERRSEYRSLVCTRTKTRLCVRRFMLAAASTRDRQRERERYIYDGMKG